MSQISACVREVKGNGREKFVMKRRNYRWVRPTDTWREARKAKCGIGRKRPGYLGHLVRLEAVGQRMWCSDTYEYHTSFAMKCHLIKYIHWYNHVCLICWAMLQYDSELWELSITGTLSLVKDLNQHGTPHINRGSWWPVSHHWDSRSVSEKPALNFIVLKMTLAQALFPVPLFSLIRIILPTHHAHSFIARTFEIESVLSWRLKNGRYL
jgi:hypothetical protein